MYQLAEAYIQHYIQTPDDSVTVVTVRISEPLGVTQEEIHHASDINTSCNVFVFITMCVYVCVFLCRGKHARKLTQIMSLRKT